jgi:protein-arginine kinase activator protein McsA
MKVPEMVNKTLRVYCPNCGRSFEVYFKKKKFKFSDILKSFKKAT